ncbi:thiamine pyrophosphate-binding protein [Nonomuraea rubra]|uniref:thiamine pyrophosphate-binding protein n=1 Tax=Nonomuraea rubra TaxID=46180 RepID=UPI0033CBBF29
MHAADGYARTTGTLGVALVSTGPGTANAMGGLYEASFASSRVLLITGRVESAHLGRGRGYIHEADSRPDMLGAVCRTVARARRAGDLGAEVVRLARDVLTGRPRPAALEIPIDLQRLPAEAPVVTSREGRGALAEDHPPCLDAFPAVEPPRSYVESSDLVLAVGTRFQMYSTGSWRLRLPENLIHLDVEPSTRERIGAEMGPDHEAICASIRRHLPRHGVVVRGAHVIVRLFNDRGYGVLREIIRDSRDAYEGAAEDVDLATPDFASLGAAFGIAIRSIGGVAAFERPSSPPPWPVRALPRWTSA